MTKRTDPREVKLRLIGQAHVLPGMSLARWHELVLQKHGLSGAGKNDWSRVPDATLDAIVSDIQAATETR